MLVCSDVSAEFSASKKLRMYIRLQRCDDRCEWTHFISLTSCSEANVVSPEANKSCDDEIV